MTADLWLIGGLCAVLAALVLAVRTLDTVISASWRRTHLDIQLGRIYAGIGWYRGERLKALGLCVCEASEGSFTVLLVQVAKLCLVVGVAAREEAAAAETE
jgi:hypothetical protein